MAPPSDGSWEQVLMLLGELKQGLAGVREDISEVKLEAKTDRLASSESRKLIYEKMEDGERKIMEVESTLRVLGGVVEKSTNRLDALEPTVRNTARIIKTWTVRGGIILGALSAVGGFVWWAILQNGGPLWNLILNQLSHK